jgi:uncharacterized protein (DUF927 family)/ribosomal protein L37AE/L43A
MNQNADLDKKINWKQFYLRYFKEMKSAGTNKMLVLCPFHDDTKPSMWFNTENGLWKCEACGASGNGQTFLEKIENIDSKEAYKRLLKEAGEYREMEKNKTAPAKYTVEDYASVKCLPVEFLTSLGIKNGKVGISIPYMDEAGTVICNRQRYAPGSSIRFSWSKGSKVNLYGLWRMQEIRSTGYVVLVEGESDTHTLWYHGFSALGVPGASTFQPAWTEYVKGLKVYVYIEPDISGETMYKKTFGALSEGGFEGEAYQISIQGYKDPSDLHIADPDNFKERWKTVLKMAQPVDLNELKVKVEETVPGTPVQLRNPVGWRMEENGIFRIDDKTGLPACVCRTPILLSRRMKSLDTGEEKIEIAYKRDSTWHTAILQRSTIFQSRTITQLADLGVTVTSENAKHLVRFLGALEAENIDILQACKCVGQLGWCGKNFLPTHAGDIVLDIDPSTKKWADAYCENGTLDEWVEAIRPFRENYIFRFILASSFAAPLLKLLNHRVFFVHNWGDSRSGKTAALKAALSVWGDPEELLTSFNATKVGLERIAGFFNDLPLGIDEKQVAGNKQDFIETLVYMLSTGSSKLRGAKSGGIQTMRSWKTIVLTTGEEPLTAMSSQTGVSTRAIEIQGAPFQDEIEARSMHEVTSKFYGTAGKAFIDVLLQYTGNLREQLQTIQNTLNAQFPDKLGSHVSSTAVVTLADQLVSERVFGENTGNEKSMEMAQKVLSSLEDVREADVTERAYEFLRSWTASNAVQFTDDARPPRYGFVEGNDYYIFPSVLEEALTKAGYSYRKIIKTFGERGLIETSIDTNKKRYSITKKFLGRTHRLVHIYFDDLEQEEQLDINRWLGNELENELPF